MTGELRSQVLGSGALAVADQQEPSDAALFDGMDAAQHGVGNALFQARSRRLLGLLPAAHVASFVSGVLIGDELRHEAADDRPLTAAAQGPLAWAYDAALAHAGRTRQPADPERLAAKGLWRIAMAARLI
jgi:2-dehydro-3-deoxygalactonokinase